MLQLVESLAPTIGVVAAGWLAYRVGRRQSQVTMHVEMTDRFSSLVALAHSRGPGGRSVGISEQVAAVHLIAAIGKRDKLFRSAASRFLESFEEWGGQSSDGLEILQREARKAREELP